LLEGISLAIFAPKIENKRIILKLFWSTILPFYQVIELCWKSSNPFAVIVFRHQRSLGIMIAKEKIMNLS
jgi:hypothetical protein